MKQLPSQHLGFSGGTWFVLLTKPGAEQEIKRSVERLFGSKFDLYIPSRELFHTSGGTFRKVIKPLFPGYIFFSGDIASLLDGIRKTHLKDRVHPLRNGESLTTACRVEMQRLLGITGPDGLMGISQAVMTKDRRIEITEGPLKELGGEIIFVNKRKRKAKIQIKLMNRDMHLTLGVEIRQAA